MLNLKSQNSDEIFSKKGEQNSLKKTLHRPERSEKKLY